MSRKGTYQVLLDEKTAGAVQQIAEDEQRTLSNTLAMLIKAAINVRKNKKRVNLSDILPDMKGNEG